MDRTPAPSVSFEQFSADRLRRDSEQITRDWVEKLSSQLGVRPRRVLPSHDLLDSIPPVLAKAAEFLVSPEEQKITAQQLVTDQMREIARIRRRQGYDVQEIIREFDELAEILDGAALRWLDEHGGTPDPKSVGRVFGRLNRAPLLMGEITVGVYREEELESRHTTARSLREFAETLMHQLKTPLAAAEGAALLLENDEITSDPEERRRFAGMIRRNLSRARTVVDDVRALALAQLAQARAGRFLNVGEVIGEVLAEVRPLAEESGVRLEVQEPVPDLVVDASRVEIVLHNLIGNAAKYADPGKPARWVRISFTRPPRLRGVVGGGGRQRAGDPAGDAGADLRPVLPGAPGGRGGERAGAGDRAGGGPAAGQPPGVRQRAGTGDDLLLPSAPCRAGRGEGVAPTLSRPGCARPLRRDARDCTACPGSCRTRPSGRGRDRSPARGR
jgi:signal transduction histidine kinase